MVQTVRICMRTYVYAAHMYLFASLKRLWLINKKIVCVEETISGAGKRSVEYGKRERKDYYTHTISFAIT